MDRISWETHEYLHTHKTTDWYWIVGMVAVSAALIAVILNNIIFAILIVVSAFALTLVASRPPKLVNVEINRSGVTINRTHYPYSDLDSFWIETDSEPDRIIIKSKKTLMHYITVFIEDVHPEDIHDMLAQYLPVEKHTEPLLEKLLVYLGF